MPSLLGLLKKFFPSLGPPPGLNWQVDGTSNGYQLPASSIVTGYAFAISTGGWLVRVKGDHCAGGFAMVGPGGGEHWPFASDAWPAAFTITHTRVSITVNSQGRWIGINGETDGPSANQSPYAYGYRLMTKASQEPNGTHHRVTRGGVLVAWVEPDSKGGKWTTPGDDASLVLDPGQSLQFVRFS
jgi:hypothetical protein